MQSLRRKEQLHDQVLELELHALALQEQVEQVQAAAATEVAAAEATGQATTAGELEDAEFFEVFFAEAVGWLLDRVDGGQLEAEEQARWEDIRRELAEWHEGPSEEEEKEEESLPSLPSIPEGEAEPEEKVRCTSGWAEWQEEEMEERLPGIPDEDAEPAKKVRCTSATCASQKVWYAGQWRGQWLGLCGCPFVLKEMAGVMVVCAVEDENGKEE